MIQTAKLKLIQFTLWILDKLDAWYNTPCQSYGGTYLRKNGKYAVRVCSKLRWHTDSHCYDVWIEIYTGR